MNIYEVYMDNNFDSPLYITDIVPYGWFEGLKKEYKLSNSITSILFKFLTENVIK